VSNEPESASNGAAREQWGAGDRAKWDHWGLVRVGGREYPLIWGEHKHSYSDNKMYVEMGKEPTAFDGHRVLIDILIKSGNYLKESHYSGDEVRKSCTAQIVADGEVVYEFGGREPEYVLLRAHHMLGVLKDHPSNLLVKKERERLVGRKIYYRDHPAVIDRLILDQGCIIIKSADGQPFPSPAWREKDDEREASIKDDILTPHIWWFRD
jgi:hypothetical protein